ncbi:hypothetical protein NPIL_211411, partial [Nephila pilipes]
MYKRAVFHFYGQFGVLLADNNMLSFNFSQLFCVVFVVAMIVLLNVVDVSEAGAGACLVPED